MAQEDVEQMKMYGCILCESSFSSSEDLRSHVSTCRPQNPFFCKLCSRRYSKVSKLEKHISQHSLGNHQLEKTNKNDRFVNDVSDLETSSGTQGDLSDSETNNGYGIGHLFNSRYSLPNEELRTKRIIKIEPTECANKTDVSLECEVEDDDKYAAREKKFREDPHCKQKDTNFTCSVCFHVSETKADFQAHLNTHFNESLPSDTKVKCIPKEKAETQCNICGKVLSKPSHLRRHKQLVHAGPSKYVCPVCSRSFDTKRQFANHARVHKNLSESAKSLAAEQKSKSSPEENITESAEPGANASGGEDTDMENETSPNDDVPETLSSEEDELMQLVKSKNHVCDECGRGFSEYRLLVNHLRTHAGFFRYKCSQCNKKFRLKKTLLAHSRSHKWSKKDHLRVHKTSVHSKSGSLDCPVCNEIFSSKRQLSNHVRNHGNFTEDGRKGTYSVESDTLNTRIGELLGKCIFQCQICSSSFTDENEFEDHFRSQHPDLLSGQKSDSWETGDENSSDLPFKEEPNCELGMIQKDSSNSPNNKLPGSSYSLIMESKRYVCGVCQKACSRLYHLKRHLITHTDVRIHACLICGKKFKTKETLKAHLDSHNTKKIFPCSLCDKSFINARRLKVHSECHQEEKKFQCDQCGHSFPSLSRLNQHQKSHNPGKYACPECGRVFGRREHLKVHMQSHKDPSEKPVLCELCGTRVWSQYLLKKHMLVHSGQMPFTCETCGKQFKQSQSLKDHMYVHTGEPKPHACTLCEKRCSLPCELRKHMKEKHGEKQHTCLSCGKKFSRKNQLSTHIRLIHTVLPTHSCPQCEKVFKTLANLHVHLKRHEHVWSQQCQFCHLIFMDRFLLRQHEDEHRGKVRPHACHQCDRKFNDVATLKKHRQLVHHKGENHPCNLCSMSFTFYDDLKKHEATHSLDRPYMCELCHVRFSRKYHLERHFKSQHSQKNSQTDCASMNSA